ncbi:hypothetical protein P3T23_009580 [Paraburkholderia sp. GAS448]|uniref:hypothetical protein n=1 Tax=Paraburkholderia sp. GAS448 TaxID=3035136 RepID=UPI003D195F97
MTKRDRTEELTLVFMLKDPTDSAEMILGEDKVKFQPRTGSVAPLDALNLLICRMQALGIQTTFTEGRRTISTTSLRKQVETKGTWGHLETADLSLRYGVAGSYDHCFVSIREKVANVAGDWKAWMIPFVELDGFVEGWVADVEYNHWQNAKDPIEYEVTGRDFSHLPMKSNGLPPPLEQMEIDTSRNPGRWVLRSGYVEAVGAVMWLSELFWDRVGRDHKNRLNSTEWPQTSEPAKGIMEVRISERCFISEETADIQNRLRACLYS